VRLSALARTLIFLAAAALLPGGDALAETGNAPALVSDVLSLPDDQLDYSRAKLALDRIIDPSIDAQRALAEVDRLARAANGLAGADRTRAGRLSALRRVIYESGPWNGGRPFSYDHATCGR
jgi:hypothetical protein